MTSGILRAGAYIPKRRLQRSAIHAANAWFAPGLKGLAKGERAVANWDEDPITMAVEAGRDCMSGHDRAGIDHLVLASTTLPFADRLNAGVVKEALNLADTTGASDMTGSQRAATTMLINALGSQATQLCLSAELRKARLASEAELGQGDAAAAVLIGEGDIIARCLGTYSVTIDFVDHFRMTGAEFDYFWESRWIREEGYNRIMANTVTDALVSFGVNGKSIDRLIVPVGTRGVADGLARACGINPDAVCDPLDSSVGHTGTTHPLLMLTASLETAAPGDRILLTSFGQGTDVVLLEATEAIQARACGAGFSGHLRHREQDSNYMRYLFHRGHLNMERGMRAELDEKQPGTTLYRHRKAVLGLVGGRCSKTGTVQFPKSDISVNQNDRAQGTQEDYTLAERAVRIVTHTADSLTYSPDPPNHYGMVDFEGGGRLTCEFADVEEGGVEVGQQMRMMFRIKAVDEARGFKRYFWKAAPGIKGAQ